MSCDSLELVYDGAVFTALAELPSPLNDVSSFEDRVQAGFANVVSDGFVHAWLQDVMVAERVGRRGLGQAIVAACADGARTAGCEILHVDFDEDLSDFYIGGCRFTPTSAGLLDLTTER